MNGDRVDVRIGTLLGNEEFMEIPTSPPMMFRGGSITALKLVGSTLDGGKFDLVS
jgi:hypothetical protein